MALRKLVAGNWKMNGSLESLSELDAIAAAATGGVDVAICPPATLIGPAVARQSGLMIGGQDCHWNASGAHTGCLSVAMLAEAGATLVIVGHSERRADNHETSADVKAKAEAAIAGGLTAIVCVGETEAERDAGRAVAVVTGQLNGSVPGNGTGDTLVIAYEPVWAIGTGRTALLLRLFRKVTADAKMPVPMFVQPRNMARQALQVSAVSQPQIAEERPWNERFLGTWLANRHISVDKSLLPGLARDFDRGVARGEISMLVDGFDDLTPETARALLKAPLMVAALRAEPPNAPRSWAPLSRTW